MRERKAVVFPRLFGASGAVAAAAGVGLAAYAAHGSDGSARSGLSMAAVFLLCHGVAVAVLAPRTQSGLARSALFAILAGSLLFAGSLLAAHLSGHTARLAPAGGMLMIGGWLLHAAASLRG